MATDDQHEKSSNTIQLVVTDEGDEEGTATLTVRPGMRFEVREVTFVDPQGRPSGTAFAARLCGMGSNTCLALTEISE